MDLFTALREAESPFKAATSKEVTGRRENYVKKLGEHARQCTECGEWLYQKGDIREQTVTEMAPVMRAGKMVWENTAEMTEDSKYICGQCGMEIPSDIINDHPAHLDVEEAKAK